MKRLLIAAVLLASGVSLPAQGCGPGRLSMLKSIGQCPDCDLSGVNLAGVNLTTNVIGGDEVDLAGAQLAGANPTDANLMNPNLTGLDLSTARLCRTTLPGNYRENRGCRDPATPRSGQRQRTSVSGDKPLPSVACLPDAKTRT